nr:13411_t:CDS:10 [Entrophospora candida]
MVPFFQISKLTSEQLDKKIALYVWVTNINEKGNSLWFITGQDSSGYIQIVVKNRELISRLKKRKKEDNKYRYRYLDLRNPSSKRLLLIKNQFCYELRKFFHERGFVDIETPILSNNSPEGAKCFVVPSNLKNRFYTLPQSAQIFKQLLMVSGFDKYYQIAKSFRNEDARSNRQIEFSQLELEMSFITSQQIRLLIEEMLKIVLKNVFGFQIKIPFPFLTYQETIKKYGTDKPDLQTKKYEVFRHPFTTPQEKYIKPLLNNEIKPEEVICEAFDLVLNGEEILSGSIRIHQAELQSKVLEILGYGKEEQKESFGYFLQALEFAAPPHGGIGLGIDRLLAIILNTSNLKELIAFPKNIDGTCSLTGTPNFQVIINQTPEPATNLETEQESQPNQNSTSTNSETLSPQQDKKETESQELNQQRDKVVTEITTALNQEPSLTNNELNRILADIQARQKDKEKTQKAKTSLNKAQTGTEEEKKQALKDLENQETTKTYNNTLTKKEIESRDPNKKVAVGYISPSPETSYFLNKECKDGIIDVKHQVKKFDFGKLSTRYMFNDTHYETDRLSKYLNSHAKVLEQNKKIEVVGLFTSKYLEDYPRSFGQKASPIKTAIPSKLTEKGEVAPDSKWDQIMKACKGTIKVEEVALGHKDLRELLLATGDANLIEDPKKEFYSSQNQMGKILMEIRKEIKEGRLPLDVKNEMTGSRDLSKLLHPKT